jgi:uncharacterized delta-60 repeat protein
MKADLREHTRRSKCLRRTVYLISLIAIFFEYRLAVAAEPLELDETFGVGSTGKVTINCLPSKDIGYDVLVQQDGIIALGISTLSPGGSPESKTVLLRLKPDGTPDPQFGTSNNGCAITDVDLGAVRAVLRPDGKIVVVGSISGNIALMRYNSEGTPDQTFGTGGLFQIELAGTEIGVALALQKDDLKIVVVGQQQNDSGDDFVIARVLPDGGGLDTSFGQGGTVITDFGGSDSPSAVDIQADGKIVVVGVSWGSSPLLTRGAIARYNPTGTLDPSFNGGLAICQIVQLPFCGKRKIKFGGKFSDYPKSMALRRADGVEDGRIVVAGQFGVARLNSDGSVDKTFGNAGIMDNPDNDGNAVAILGNGRIVVAGGSNFDFAVASYTTSGGSCSSKGALTTDFAGGTDSAQAMAVQSDGKVVLMGYASQPSKGGPDWDFALARYKVGDCQIRWWGDLVSFNIFVHPRDIIDGPPPIPQLQIVRSQQFAIPASDGEAFAGPTRPGFEAFPLTNAGGEREDRQRGSLVRATNVLGSPMLELLEAQQILVPTDIEGERVGGGTVAGSVSAPLLKCYRVKIHSINGAHRDRRTFTITDALGRRQTLEVGEPESFCKPVDRRGRELIGEAVSLVGYPVKDIKGSGRSATSVRLRVVNEFAPPRVLQVEHPELVYLPSLAE